MKRSVIFTKFAFHLAAGLPLLWLVIAIKYNLLSADPAKDIQHFTGLSALRLLVALSLIPLVAQLFKWNNLFQVRKLLGLWCFTWASLHLASYLLLEIGWNNLSFFFSEIVTRTYLVIGFTCWLMLLLMALSSFEWLRVNLNLWWKRIHNLFFPALFLVTLHYILSLKTLTPEPFIYLAMAILTFTYRVWSKK